MYADRDIGHAKEISPAASAPSRVTRALAPPFVSTGDEGIAFSNDDNRLAATDSFSRSFAAIVR